MVNDLARNWDWDFPVPIAYGPGRLAEMGRRCRAMGVANPLIVTDRGSAGLPFIEQLRRILAADGLGHGTYADVSPNPRDDEIAAGVAAFHRGAHDGVIAIGGGSGMDAGKAVCLMASGAADLWGFEWERPPADVPNGFAPLICIPTTAGTGAETDSTAMITDTDAGMKLCVAHPELKPKLALLDPELTFGLPANLTAWTGIDALVHAIEGYCVPSLHPLCDGAALQGMALIGTHLERAVASPHDIDARGGMLIGSCLAGISFLKGLGLVHAISHMVGAEFDTHHGLTNAIVLPAVLQFNKHEMGPKIAPMARALGCAETSFEGFHDHTCGVLDRLDIPRGLGALGVTPDRAAPLAEKAERDAAAGTNPRLATREQLVALIAKSIEVAR